MGAVYIQTREEGLIPPHPGERENISSQASLPLPPPSGGFRKLGAFLRTPAVLSTVINFAAEIGGTKAIHNNLVFL